MVDDSKNSRKMSMGNRFCQSTTGIKFVKDLNMIRSTSLFMSTEDALRIPMTYDFFSLICISIGGAWLSP